MFRDALQAGVSNVGLALRRPEEFAVRCREGSFRFDVAAAWGRWRKRARC